MKRTIWTTCASRRSGPSRIASHLTHLLLICSLDMDKRMVEASSKNLYTLQGAVRQTKEEDVERLHREYEQLLRGLREENPPLADELPAESVLPEDVVREAMPEEI